MAVMLDGWSEVVEDYILAENIIRIGTIHRAFHIETHIEQEKKSLMLFWYDTKNCQNVFVTIVNKSLTEDFPRFITVDSKGLYF